MFTNEHVRKEQKRRKNGMFIWLGLLIAALLLFTWGYMDEHNKKETKEIYLNDIIESKDSNKTGKKAYLNVYSVPYLFAQYEDYGPKYYIVLDENYYYIVFMDYNDYDSMNREDIQTNPARITGFTKETTMDVKKLAIEAYNKSVEDGEQLVLADFENYFGSVYLDMTTTPASSSEVFYVIGTVLIILALIFAIVWGIQYYIFNKKLKKLPAEVRQKLDEEMNDKEAFYYAKAHLYLTEHFIINFGNTFDFIHYEDMIWLYPREIRNRGIKTGQSICIMTKEGKTYVVATISTMTKVAKEQYEEIFNTLASKKENLIIGYTKEAKAQIKEQYNLKV